MKYSHCSAKYLWTVNLVRRSNYEIKQLKCRTKGLLIANGHCAEFNYKFVGHAYKPHDWHVMQR